ncbi:lymphocyte antigen 75 [Hippoglossus stenolepis]|uniref:lymphocyte antigen 75 n=1 Tax=Hippoglossus stenolepis TaxID=195615 RepID=UPI001FAF6918|nr:lymphocyte antigen 75 [Hippoglossus stenolepis]
MIHVSLPAGLCSCLHHYVYVGELKTRSEARVFCREKHVDLATVDNMEDMQRLIAAAHGYEGDVWIGTHDKSNRWFWSARGHSINRQNKQHFQMWEPGQPNASRSHKHVCVSVTDGLWKDHRCSTQLPFVCYNKTNIHGLPDISTERYFYISDVKSWPKARAHCRLHHTDLASVRNETENTMIKQLVPSGRQALIGLHRRPFSYLSDGTSSSFGNWIEGHPALGTGDCVISRIGAGNLGKWMERHCDEKHHFMCHRMKVKHLFIIKVKALTSTISLNDPEVTDAILNLIKAGMKERGMTEGFKTAWIKKADENIFHKEEEN